jgi:hypothetical protein
MFGKIVMSTPADSFDSCDIANLNPKDLFIGVVVTALAQERETLLTLLVEKIPDGVANGIPRFNGWLEYRAVSKVCFSFALILVESVSRHFPLNLRVSRH